jgi:hypothetical protein
MWVKGTPLHFIVDRGCQKNLISSRGHQATGPASNVTPTTLYHWMVLPRKQSLCQPTVSAMSYDINPFKDEVLCDVSPLEVCDVLLGQPYLWKHHFVYESSPRSVIITLNRKFYRIPEVVPPSAISLISAKKCRKVIS